MPCEAKSERLSICSTKVEEFWDEEHLCRSTYILLAMKPAVVVYASEFTSALAHCHGKTCIVEIIPQSKVQILMRAY